MTNDECAKPKPRHLTHLGDGRLIRKDHPVIVWRGEMDCFAAFLLEAQLLGERLGKARFAAEIREIAGFVQHLIVCEAAGRASGEFRLLGWSGDEVRRLSHEAARSAGPGQPPRSCSAEMGELAVSLNRLRALCRKAESAAVTAFVDAAGQEPRPDLILALDRLSSLLYVLMFRHGDSPRPPPG
ncbi:MAG: hypothetical protein LBU23_13195 [Planctomycetota bacterium]|jgi:ethanolamine utilization cobalamin adenosyltransferase|nr:hypothetical protein [Planctomycetota bacterium]